MIPTQAVTIVSAGGTMMQLSNQRGAPYPTTGFGALVFNTGARLVEPIIEDATIEFAHIAVGPGSLSDPAIRFSLATDKTPGFFADGSGNISLVGTDGDESSRLLLASFDHPGDLTVSQYAYANGATPPLSEDSAMLATTAWVKDVVVDIASAISLPPTVATGDTPPATPHIGDLWWDSTLGRLFVWYADTDSTQWVPAMPATIIIHEEGGGGGGGGDDLDTTPVAATDSTLARVVPDWLAGAPVHECPEDVLLAPEHRGAWLHMLNDIGSMVYLPDDWLPGMAVGVRQIGIGMVQWAQTGGATMQMPVTKIAHSTISEQYEEIILRVITNTTGSNAVWSVTGGTA